MERRGRPARTQPATALSRRRAFASAALGGSLALLFACAALGAPESTTPAPDELAAAVARELASSARAAPSAVRRFYAARANAPAWLRGDGPTGQARAVAALLRDAEEKGLRSEDYGGARWAARLKKLESPGGARAAAELARLDVALTRAVLRYSSDLRRGRINPRVVEFGFAAPREPADLAAALQAFADARDVAAAAEALEPPFPSYRRASEALRRYLQLARSDDGKRLPVPRRALSRGARYAGLPRLCLLLRALGDLPADAPTPKALDASVEAALRSFQRRHALPQHGRLDSRTVRELNTPLRARVAQLQLSLERWRWLPRALPSAPLVVNVPAFTLLAEDEQRQLAFSMKVVVGRAALHETPAFAAALTSVVFKPYWNVPRAIARDELVPQFEKSPARFAQGGYEVVDRAGRVVAREAIDAALLAQVRSGALRLRQRPGPLNAVGDVKFALPDAHGIYLHGTPARRLFSRTRRDFSHGCVRVEDPERLAAWVLRHEPGWTPERVRAAMAGERTVLVALRRPIPVLVLYSTAVVTDRGEVRFFADVYGHDAALQEALAARDLS